MAMIIPGRTRCALCQEVLASGDDVVATTHFVADAGDPLHPYSDAAMHRRCFIGWELRGVFVDRYNATMGAITWGDGTYHAMQSDGRIVSKCRDLP